MNLRPIFRLQREQHFTIKPNSKLSSIIFNFYLMVDEIPLTGLLTGPGQPIEPSTARLMMALYQARIKAVAAQAPALGINMADESQQLFFKLTNLNALLTALASGSNHLAGCLGLGVLDANGNPTTPTQDQLELMQELVNLQAEGNYDEYEAKIQTIRLAQTVLIAGCDSNGNLLIEGSGPLTFYDMAGKCCRDQSTT